MEFTQFEVVGRVAELPPCSGLLLSPAQAAARAALLVRTELPGVYVAQEPVQFKHGERFGFVGDFPKASAGALQALGATSVGKLRARKAAAEATAEED